MAQKRTSAAAGILALALALASAPRGTEAAISADEVKELPGWGKALPSKHYSGYLAARNGTRHMHYYLQMSEGNPATDPVTLWMNGGPGCTSLKGGFEELGQLVFNRASFTANTTAAPELFYNPLGWTKLSTMLYFESPPGVGFSYCDECLGNSTCDCVANDLTTAEDNHDALVSFFKGFPELSQNDFYITGESYAGAYIPTLMDQIHKAASRRGQVTINLKGAAVGNGVGGGNGPGNGADGGRIRAKFYVGKGMVSEALGDQIIQACGPLSYPSSAGWNNHSEACDEALGLISTQVGPHNLYNVEDFCPSLHPDPGQGDMDGDGAGFTLRDWDAAMATRGDGTLPRMDKLLHDSPTTGATGATILAHGYPDGGAGAGAALPLGQDQKWCGVDDAMMTWLSVPAVKEALHIATPKGSERNNLRYTAYSYPGYVHGDYRQLYKSLAEHYRLWIYNGQEDGCVPFVGAQEWTSHLGFPEANAWHPWFTTDEGGGARVAAGYSTSYGGAAVDFAFVTIKGAGHEVPTYKPSAAYTMYSAFLNGTRL